MASPFTLVANATATFNLPTTGTITDSLGNVRPVTQQVTATLFLRAAPDQQPVDLPGVEATTVVLSGYAVNPMALDTRIRNGTTGTLSWQGRTHTFTVNARNETYGDTGFIAETLTSKRGDDIRLTLQRQA